MHILNIIQCTNLGGMEQASFRLMKGLQSCGHNLSVISLNPIGDLGPLMEKVGIQAVGLNYGKDPTITTIRKLRRAVSAAGADALILTGHNFIASMALIGVGPKKRLFSMHYHHEGVMQKYRWRMIYRVAVMQFQTITFPSDYVRREAEALYPKVKKVALTVRNPLEVLPQDQKGNRAQFRASLGIALDAPLIGNAGWLIPRKRFDIFLRTAALVLNQRPDAHFVIAGDGESRNDLEALCGELGLMGRVHFTGWLTELSSFYDAIDVLLFNSDWDAFGLTPVEAMARAIPVVASLENGGLSEVLNDETGWLLDHHDANRLASNVIEALEPRGRIKGIAARRVVSEMCSPPHIAQLVGQRLLGGTDADLPKIDRPSTNDLIN